MKQQARPRELRTGKSHNGLEKAHSSSDHVYGRVAVLAYSMYEQRGRQDGHDIEDWIEAEKTVAVDHEKSVFTDDLLRINRDYRGLLERFSEFVRYVFGEQRV